MRAADIEPPTSTRSWTAVPEELRALRQWVTWRYEQKGGASKPTKVPYSPTTGRKADTTSPVTWASFEDAVQVAERCGYDGIGFVFSTDDPYVGVDLDQCIGDTGQLVSWARDIVDALDSYTERTPSKAGLHVIVRAASLPSGGKKGPVEMYSDRRYFTVTGEHWSSTPTSIEARPAEVERLYRSIFGDRKHRQAPQSADGRATDQTDAEVIDTLRRSMKRDRFEKLWSGDWKALHASQSEADLELSGLLAAYGCDAAQIDRIVRHSRLFRPKWDEARGDMTYGERTILRALETASSDGLQTQVLDEMNRDYGLVNYGGAMRVLQEIRDDTGKLERVSFLTKNDFLTLTMNLPSPTEGASSRGLWWLKQPGRRAYDAVDFLPGGAAERVYNLWRGFPVEAKKGACRLFWRFVYEVIANGDADVFRYLVRWMAHMVQRPGELPTVALVLRGGQGTGKNTFVDALGSLVPEHFRTVSRMEHVTGKFNAHFLGALLVHANEATWGGSKSEAGALKALITDNKIPIEAKGQNLVEVSNFTRLIASSNEQWAVAVDLDDRRFLILDVSNLHQQDAEYFGAIHAELENGGRAALMRCLSQVSLHGFHPRNKPATRFGVDMKLRSADSATRWWFEILTAGEIPDYSVLSHLAVRPPWPRSIEKKQLHDNYLNWCRSQSERHTLPESAFFRALRTLAPSVKDVRPAATQGRATRPRSLQLGSLLTHRTEMEHVLNGGKPIRWGR